MYVYGQHAEFYSDVFFEGYTGERPSDSALDTTSRQMVHIHLMPDTSPSYH